MGDEPEPAVRPRYKWPRLVLAFLLAGVALAVVWMSVEVRRLRQYRDPDPLSAPANRPAPRPGAATNSIPPANVPPRD